MRVEHGGASLGSACRSGTGTVSGVLAAMGFGIERAKGAVRLSLGIFTTDEEVRYAAQALVKSWRGRPSRDCEIPVARPP